MSIPYFDSYLARHSFTPKAATPPLPSALLSVVIPCYNEPDILLSLESLRNCDPPPFRTEVIIVLNYPVGSPLETAAFHRQTQKNITAWINAHPAAHIGFLVIEAPALPKKFAGVGLARKIGMDEAVSRFSQTGNEEGIICGFDADSLTDKNYLTAIGEHFSKFSKTPGASVYFEHPVEETADPRLQSGIIQYEMHLRYLVQAIRSTGFPYAYHTVGSSFAVKAGAYVKQGGMNKFKAGEDFYFLNKIIPLGNYTEINTTRVIPQARVSDRVPFGTGASMNKWMEDTAEDFLTYNYHSFVPLRELFGNLELIYRSASVPVEMVKDKVMRDFLEEHGATEAIEEVKANSGSYPAFRKRFFNWFDAFKIVKYLNFAAAHAYPKKAVKHEVLNLMGMEVATSMRNMEMLTMLRNIDRSGWNPA